MARHDSKRKLQRNAQLLRLADEHPEMSYAEIAESFNISRERAFQIIKKAREKANQQHQNTQEVPTQA